MRYHLCFAQMKCDRTRIGGYLPCSSSQRGKKAKNNLFFSSAPCLPCRPCASLANCWHTCEMRPFQRGEKPICVGAVRMQNDFATKCLAASYS